MGRARGSGLLLLLSACSGTPIEADTIGGEGSSGGGASTGATTTLSTSSAGETAAEGSGDPSGDPSEDSTSDSNAGSSSRGDTTNDLSAGTSGDHESSDGESSDGAGSSTTGELGGCLGESLPEVAPAMCSQDDVTEAQLDISNTCGYAIEVFWVGYDCGEVSYQVIAGGDDWGVGSYATHPWRIRNQRTGELMLEIPPLDGDTIVVVQ